MINYVRFIFENVEPLKIADDSTSQSGQVNTLTYVPGSTLRGAVINAFVKTGKLDEYKAILLSDKVAFLNAYIMADDKELIPSLKGFYEDKTEPLNGIKKIENLLVEGGTTPGYKRAALGKYCYPDGDTIYYTGVLMGSDMKINKGKDDADRNVFRNQYIEPGYRFAAYIAVYDDDSMEISQKIKQIIEYMRDGNSLLLGGSRSFGYGKCTVLGAVKIVGQMPYDDYVLNEDANDSVYMALLSDTVMLNDSGEITGMNTTDLAEKLGVSNIAIDSCATSVVDVRGYNRTWQAWVPSSKMYEKGSVFKLNFKGETVAAGALRKVMDEGIGIRTNEGYGRVLFLKDYDKITNKKVISVSRQIEYVTEEKTELTPDEEKTLRIAAKGYYMNCIDRAENEYLADETKDRKKLADYKRNGSQMRAIEAILYKNLYTEDAGFDKLLTYLQHAGEKDENLRVQKGQSRRGDVAEYIKWVQNTTLTDIFKGLPQKVMGIDADELLDEKEINRIKQQLLISEIKRYNRGGKGDEQGHL